MNKFINITQIVSDVFTNDLAKFGNRHEGETCYIIGDGPSIKWFDLSEFSNYPAICCGLIPFHKDFEQLDVKYIIEIEPWLFVPKIIQPKILHGYRQIAAALKQKLQSIDSIEIFVNLSNRFNISGENINYIYRNIPNPRNQLDKAINGMGCFAGSFHATLTLAYYLGYKKVYLVGFDAWTIQPARTLRWYELGDGEYLKTTNFAIEYLIALKSKMDIYTISKDGDSCNVKNINYKEYTGKLPKFKENTELLSRHYLDIISTRSDYKVYSDDNKKNKSNH